MGPCELLKFCDLEQEDTLKFLLVKMRVMEAEYKTVHVYVEIKYIWNLANNYLEEL